MKTGFVIALIFFSIIAYGQKKTVSNYCNTPGGFKRVAYPEKSFSSFVQKLPVKDDNLLLSHIGGNATKSFYNVFAVIDFPLLFKSDIEQCADYSMRLWAEYHKQSSLLDKLYLFDYSGKKIFFKNQNQTYKQFLQKSFSFSNSFSLKAGCKKIIQEELRPGDMFVQNETGGIGHVSVIVDVCNNEAGEKLFLVGYSFMPAQEFHIEKAAGKYGKDGWFSYNGYLEYLNDFLNYGKPVLRRFE